MNTVVQLANIYDAYPESYLHALEARRNAVLQLDSRMLRFLDRPIPASVRVNERIIAEALSHRYCTCMKIAIMDLSRSEYNMPTSNKS